MQVEFSFHLFAYFWKEEFLMTLNTSALHSVLFVAFKECWKYLPNHTL